MNGGLDQFRTGPYRDIFALPWRSSAHVVWHSLTHADAVIRHYGVRNWLRKLLQGDSAAAPLPTWQP